MSQRRGALLDRYFYLAMALIIPVVVAYGFSFTIGQNLLHPVVARPPMLYVHAAVFSGWLVFFLLQAALVRTRRVSWHRRAGWFGAALGASIVVLGTTTALTMGRFNMTVLHSTTAQSDLLIPLFDMAAFACSFAAALYFRRQPPRVLDEHRPRPAELTGPPRPPLARRRPGPASRLRPSGSPRCWRR